MTNTYFNKDHLQQAIQSPPPIVLMKGHWMEVEYTLNNDEELADFYEGFCQMNKYLV